MQLLLELMDNGEKSRDGPYELSFSIDALMKKTSRDQEDQSSLRHSVRSTEINESQQIVVHYFSFVASSYFFIGASVSREGWW